MKRINLSLPQFLFVVGTRAALGAGVGMLATLELRRQSKKRLGLGLLAFGALTTIPAARFVLSEKRKSVA